MSKTNKIKQMLEDNIHIRVDHISINDLKPDDIIVVRFSQSTPVSAVGELARYIKDTNVFGDEVKVLFIPDNFVITTENIDDILISEIDEHDK